MLSTEGIAHLSTAEDRCAAAFFPGYVACGSGASNWCRSQHFRFTPTRADVGADIVEPPLRASSGREQLQRGNPLFDHDVGAQQEGFRDLQPDRLCRLEVDDQLEFRGLLNWNVFGMLAL